MMDGTGAGTAPKPRRGAMFIVMRSQIDFFVFQPRSFCCLKEPQVLGPMIHWEQRKSGAEKQKGRFDGADPYKHGTPPGFGRAVGHPCKEQRFVEATLSDCDRL